MIKIFMLLFLTGCAGLPVCNEHAANSDERESCREQREAQYQHQERMWRYDRFDRR